MTDYNYSFKKPNRDIHSVFLHCSASDDPSHDNIQTMRNWHLARPGFTDVGYHFFIRKDGTLEMGRSLLRIPAAQDPHNTGTIAICCHGLLKRKFTKYQFKTLRSLCIDIQNAYKSKKLRFRGHSEVSPKSCPVYDYKSVLSLDDKGYLKDTSNSMVPDQCYRPTHTPIFNPVLSMLVVSNQIIELQTCLSVLYGPVKVDGVFGQQTRISVESAQRKCGVRADGDITQSSYAKVMTVRRGDKGGKVGRVQRLLQCAGFPTNDDCDFGPDTWQSVINFQRKYGLKDDGIVGPQTLSQFSKLGLTNYK